MTRAHAVRAISGRPVTCDIDALALPTLAISLTRVAAILIEPTSPHHAPEPDTDCVTVPCPARAPPLV